MASILIIDDEDLVRSTLRKILEKEGHEVHEAANGNEGLELIKKTWVHLVITDMIMPEKGGVETITEIREDFPDKKIIAISGGARVSDKNVLKFTKRLGADFALPKPFNKDMVVKTVNKCLDSES